MQSVTHRIGLALSGGGFRASLYHLGLVRFLRDAGLLSRVTHITSVSGGSIFAAHLLLNWDRYSGSPSEFDAVASEFMSCVRLDLRNRIIRRVPLTLPFRWPRRLLGFSNRKLTRTGMLEYHYEKFLYGDKSLFELPERPALHILATNLSEGCLCSFNRNGLLMVRRRAGNSFHVDRIHIGLATVAMAVTASSAFPGFFPPLELTGANVGANPGEFGRQAFTDGAVFDNLGVRMFRCLERSLLAESPLCPEDFYDFHAVVEALSAASISAEETPLRRLAQLLVAACGRPQLLSLAPVCAVDGAGLKSAAASDSFARAASSSDGRDGNGETALVSVLWDLLRDHQFYHEPLFAGLKPADPDADALFCISRRHGQILDADDQLWLNRHLIDAAFRQATGRACLRRLNSGLDGVLVSDVGKSMEVQANRRAGGLLRTAARATDILMDRVWQLEMETFLGTPGFVFAPMTDIVEPCEDPTALHPEIQRQAAKTRTDLDRFSPLEISSLVRHGYCVGRKACRAHPELFGSDLPKNPPWDPIPGPRDTSNTVSVPVRANGRSPEPAPATVEARNLQASAARRIWSTLPDRRDWTTYIYVPLIIPILTLLPYFAFKYYQKSHRLNQLIQAISQGSPDLEAMSRLLDHGSEPRWPSVAAEEVAKLDEPDINGFEIIQDSWITDLRRWKPVVPGRSDTDAYVHHYRRLMVSKTPDNAGNDVFRWTLLALDPKANFRFSRQELQAKLRKCMNVDSSAPGERACRWEADFSFRNVPVGDPVHLIVEYQSAGLFLQHSENTTTVPLNVRADTAELTAWILMPEGKEYANFHVIRHEKGRRDKVERVRVISEYLATDYTILAFKLLSLVADYDYEVIWTYR
jgi:predicted acylesterase/phospholipase RssA